MMESVFRYIVIIVIAFIIGREMFQSIRQKSVDWCLLVIIVLFGIAIFMSRSFFSFYSVLWLSRNMCSCPRYLCISFKEVNKNFPTD